MTRRRINLTGLGLLLALFVVTDSEGESGEHIARITVGCLLLWFVVWMVVLVRAHLLEHPDTADRLTNLDTRMDSDLRAEHMTDRDAYKDAAERETT